MLNRNAERRHCCLMLIFRGNASNFLPIQCDVRCGLSSMDRGVLLFGDVFLLIHSLLRAFNMKGTLTDFGKLPQQLFIWNIIISSSF